MPITTSGSLVDALPRYQLLDPMQLKELESLRRCRGMPLLGLGCNSANVADLSPLKELFLKELTCDFKPERDAELLRSLKTLEKINDKPVQEFWKEVEAKQGENKP